jgi:hypothetical protein
MSKQRIVAYYADNQTKRCECTTNNCADALLVAVSLSSNRLGEVHVIDGEMTDVYQNGTAVRREYFGVVEFVQQPTKL